MIVMLLCFILAVLLYIARQLIIIKEAKLIGLQMLAEQNSWDQDKINQISDEVLKRQ